MFPSPRTRTRVALLRAVDRAIEFATLGEYGLEVPGSDGHAEAAAGPRGAQSGAPRRPGAPIPPGQLPRRVEGVLVQPAPALHLLPDLVRPVVELDGGEQPLVVGEARGEATRAEGMVVPPGPREPLLLVVLERVVDDRDEAQERAALAALA